MPRIKTVQVTGPVILQWPDGTRIHVSPEGLASTKPSPAGAGKGRAGRKPSPATQAVIDAMEADQATGRSRPRATYLQILQDAGYDGSDAGASQILAREAKRIFGRTLGRAPAAKKTPAKRAKKAKKARAATGEARGRKPSKATELVRAKVEADAAADRLQDPTHYVRWLVQQKGLKIGLKGARPIVYRELRKVKA